MNLSRRTSLSLLFVSISTASAQASLMDDNGAAAMSIESAANNTALQPLDQLLSGGNHSDLFRSVLHRHDMAAHPTNSTMDGHYEKEGAEKPVLHGLRGPAGKTMPHAPSSPQPESPDLSLTVAAHNVSSAQSSIASASATGSGSSASAGSFVASDEDNPATPDTPVIPTAPVPLPAAGLLLASGLVALPAIRREKQK